MSLFVWLKFLTCFVRLFMYLFIYLSSYLFASRSLVRSCVLFVELLHACLLYVCVFVRSFVSVLACYLVSIWPEYQSVRFCI